MFAPIFGTWPACPRISLVQARRSQEDPKTWTKLQDTVSQDPAFGHLGPGIGHLGADIQGTGIDSTVVISELIFKEPAFISRRQPQTLTRQCCDQSRPYCYTKFGKEAESS